MIRRFEEITKELTDYERDYVFPLIVKGLSGKVGVHMAITNSKIVHSLKARDIKTSAPRVRKMIHAIRVNHLVPLLVSSSKGYYVATDIKDVEEYIDSLRQRAESILSIRDALAKQLEKK